MNINGLSISNERFVKLTGILPENVLQSLYWSDGLADREIAKRYGLSDRDVCRLRTIYGIKTDSRYQLRRNSLRHVQLTESQKQFLHGSLFGDSCIAVQNSGQGYWRCRHSIKQELYLLSKAKLMKPFTAKVFYGERAFKKGGKLFKYVDARSITHPAITEYRNMFYPNGQKLITEQLFEKLSPVGFAYWYLDDGSTEGYGFTICTFEPLFKNIDKVRELFFDVLQLEVSVHWQKSGEGLIRILRNSTDKAYEYISQIITNDLLYKLPKRFCSKDNQQPSLVGNDKEGSTTGGSLNSKEQDDNTRFEKEIPQSMPDTSQKEVVIQSELTRNCER